MNSFYKNLPVLVTGGCGFIGSHVAEQLVQLGAHVTIIDDLSTGNLDNITEFKQHITFIHDSIGNKAACARAAHGQSIIFHLAAMASVPQSIEYPDTCHEINVNGTVNILEAARLNKVSSVIFSSSSAVYGAYDIPVTEDMPCNPQSPYGYSKLMGELYCQQYAYHFGINTVALRYFNVFGPRQNPHGAYAGVIAAFKRKLSQNLPITILGDGMQTRDFIPVEQVAQANIRLGMKAAHCSGQSFNIGTGKSITLLELLDQLKKEYQLYNQAVDFGPARAGDVKHSMADCGKYRMIEKE
jgi:UDP-glucose 4-epimerase